MFQTKITFQDKFNSQNKEVNMVSVLLQNK